MIALLIICIVSVINSTNSQQQIYQRITPKYGTNTPKSVNSFSCSGNGAVIGVKYYKDKYISQLEFICSSAKGIRSYGPYGIPIGTPGEFMCPEGQYISSFYGNSDRYLTRIGVRCRTINGDLTGSGTVIGNLIGGYYDLAVGPAFDDLAYSNGARFVGAKIWNTAQSLEVDAIQFTYSNMPVVLCSVNCTQNLQKQAPLHGRQYANLAVVNCPNDGAFTGITILYTTRSSFGRINTLQFTCTSGSGSTKLEEIGTQFFGSIRTFDCPPGTIIGGIHGNSSSTLLSMGITCVVFGDTGPSPKFDAIGGSGPSSYNDDDYTNIGMRPLQLRVFYDQEINGIQVNYGYRGVGINCRIDNIEVVDENVRVVSDGSEVIGVAAGTSCYNGSQSLNLDYSRSAGSEVTVVTSKSNETTWSSSVGVSVSTGFELFGNGFEVTVGAVQDQGGAKQFSTSNSRSSTTSSGSAAGTTIIYKTPGAGIVIGYVDRYKIDQSNVNVLYHYNCDVGETEPELGTIKLTSTFYGKEYYENYGYIFSNREQCTTEAKNCVRKINASQLLRNSSSYVEEFYGCFPDGSGTKV